MSEMEKKISVKIFQTFKRQEDKKLNIWLPYDPAIPSIGIDSKELKTHPNRNVHTNVHSSIIHSGKKGKQAKCPSMDEWINKM